MCACDQLKIEVGQVKILYPKTIFFILYLPVYVLLYNDNSWVGEANTFSEC